METRKNILIIEPDLSVFASLDEQLNRLGFPFECKGTPDMSMEQLEALMPDIAIIGPTLHYEACFRTVQKLKIINPRMPILVCCERSPFSDEAADAPFSGVIHLDLKSDPESLSAGLKRGLNHLDENETLPEFPVLIGQSAEIGRIREKVRSVADKDITVLITGESGTGKELIARSLHYYSKRNRGPLIKINCGALPDELLESEVFGFQKGAFTGAHKDKPGRLELAHGGTLFVDEIGDLSPSLQVKFLQVFEDRVFSRLGATRHREVDTRVVAATNRDLAAKVREKNFRKDLYFRLNVMHIEAPPLRHRREDIAVISEFFMEKYCFEFKREPLAIPGRISDTLMTYPWPGNVRELENVIRRAIVLRDWDSVIQDMGENDGFGSHIHISPTKNLEKIRPWGDGKVDRFFRRPDFSLKSITKAYVGEVERQAVSLALRRSKWNRKKAAETLGVSYKTLLNRIEDLDISP